MTFTIDHRVVDTTARAVAPVVVGVTRTVIGFLLTCRTVTDRVGRLRRSVPGSAGAAPNPRATADLALPQPQHLAA